MTFQELKNLSIADIDLILEDQTDLYSAEELNELREWREHLASLHNVPPLPPPPQHPTVIKCPKCDGWNEPDVTECIYCNNKLENVAKQSVSSPASDQSIPYSEKKSSAGKLFIGIIILIAGLSSVSYGNSLNCRYEEQLIALWNNDGYNPGATWIVAGIVGLLLGLIFIASALFKDE